MAPKSNDGCLLTPCLRHIHFVRKTPNLAIDQFVQGIQKISIQQERSSGWLRDSFKDEFLEVETMLLRALFATPFLLNEDGFGDSLRHAWGKECIGFKATITQDELLQYFPVRYSPYLKPDETTQDLPFQERRYPFLQRLFVEPSLLQAELINGMSEPKGWGRHKWFKENPVARVFNLSEDRLLRLHACLLLGLPPNPEASHALLHAWGIARCSLKKKLDRWENCLLKYPVSLSKPPEDAHSSPSGFLSLLRSPSANMERNRKRAARSPPSTPSLRSPSPQRANRNHTPSPSTFNSSTPSRTKRILNFMRSSPRQQESVLEEQELPAAHSSPSGLFSLLRSPSAKTERNRQRAAWSSPSTTSLRSPARHRADRNHTPSPSTFNSSAPSRRKGVFNFMPPSPQQEETILEEQELPASETVGIPFPRITPNADEPEHNCARVRLVFGDNESDEEMECNPDDASSESIDPPIVTPTAAGDYDCDEEMEYNADDASSGSVDPPIVTPTSSANNFEASKEKYPSLSRYATENEFHQSYEDYLTFAFETNKKEAVQKMLSGIIDRTAKMENKKPYEAVELRVQRRNGSEMRLIQIPASTTLDRFMQNSTKTKFMEKVLKAITGETAGIDDKDSAGWLIYMLSKRYPGQYSRVVKELGICPVIPEMDALKTEAMWAESNVSIRSQRSLRRSLAEHFEGQYFLASENMTKDLTSDMIKPETGDALIDGKKISFWTRPVDQCVVYRLEKLAFVDIEEFEIVIGGDHGQGKYGEIVKVILRASGRTVLRTFTVKVGHIECLKDTYDIFKGTIATRLNESLTRLNGAWLKLRRCEETGCFLVNVVSSPSDLSVVDRADSCLVPIKLKCTGDLAYQSMKLGKVNMSGKWCPFCDASPREWCKCYHHKGRQWTLKSMDETRENCDNGVCQDVPANRKGCVQPAAVDAIEVEDHIGPALHEMMGMSNDAMEQGFLEWIDQRLEDIPKEEHEAREDAWNAEYEFESAEGVYEAWKRNKNYPQEVEGWKRQIVDLTSWSQERNPTGMNLPAFKHTSDQRKAMSADVKELREKIKNLETEHKRQQDPLKRKKALRTELNKTLKKLRDKRGKGSLGSKIRQQIDDCFVKYGADRAAFHGGDFPGVAILRLNEHINELFDDIQKILLEVDTDDRGATNEEIAQQLEAYRILFVLMDFLFSMARTPSDEVVVDLEGFLEELEEVIKETMKWWAKLGLSETTVKKHIVGAHLVDQIRRHRGIAEYYEDFVELMHQFVKMLEQRSCIRNFDVKANYQCRIEEVQNHEGIQNAREAALEGTKRNFKNPRDNRSQEKEQASRETRQTRRKEIFAVSKGFDDSKIPTGETLNKSDYFKMMIAPVQEMTASAQEMTDPVQAMTDPVQE